MKALPLLALFLLCGCAQMQADARGREYDQALLHHLGKTEAEVVGTFGTPTAVYEGEGFKALTWRVEYGSRGNAYVSPVFTASGRQVVVYDEVGFTFEPDSGGVWRATDYRYRVQR